MIRISASSAPGCGFGATGTVDIPATRYSKGWAALADPDYFWSDDEGQATVLHRLLLVDPEDDEQVKKLHDAVFRYRQPVDVDRNRLGYDDTQAALRQLATREDPEPLNLGAVVETAKGKAVRNAEEAVEGRAWVDESGVWRAWADLPRPVTVLSTGWSK